MTHYTLDEFIDQFIECINEVTNLGINRSDHLYSMTDSFMDELDLLDASMTYESKYGMYFGEDPMDTFGLDLYSTCERLYNSL